MKRPFTPENELVTIVDRENKELEPVDRRTMREKKLIHRATYILIFDQKGRMLVQKRSMRKDIYPGQWEIAAGGVVSHGESYNESAIRELMEETGIEGVPLVEHLDFYFEDEKNRVWGRLYSCQFNGEVKSQKEEVDEVIFLDPKELIKGVDQMELTPDSLFIVEKFKDLLLELSEKSRA